MKNLIVFTFLVFGICFLQSSCSDPFEGKEVFTDNFDRRAMLEDWADLIIIPSFEYYQKALSNLKDSEQEFRTNNSDLSFENLKSAYIEAYLAWQKVSIFDIGKAEEIGLRNFTNIYPTNVETIEININSGNYNLELPSNFSSQGFPALDYLLFGSAQTTEEIKNKLGSNNYQLYLRDLVDRLFNLSLSVLNDWKTTYRETFINNDGSSGTASVDKTVNDFLYYYEKFLRAGKIGIPAGIFSGNSMPQLCEAPYSKIYSKQLFLAGFQATIDFFTGAGYSTDTLGQSLSSYLQHRMEQTEGPNLSREILNQWNLAETEALKLSDSFVDQINMDNIKMLATYDELQKATIILKVDMMQALNIQVDYVDADGD